METSVQVKDEQEAGLVQMGLSDASLKAFVQVCAILKGLSDDEARMHVLHAAIAMYGPDPKP